LIEAQTQKLAIAEKDSVRAEMVLAALEKIRNMARQATKITMGLRKFAREARGNPAKATGVQEILEETLPFCMERLKQNSVELRVAPVPIDCRNDGDFAGAIEPVEQRRERTRTMAGKMGGSESENRRNGPGDFRDGQRQRYRKTIQG